MGSGVRRPMGRAVFEGLLSETRKFCRQTIKPVASQSHPAEYDRFTAKRRQKDGKRTATNPKPSMTLT